MNRSARVLAAVACALVCAALAHADWLQPDASYRDTQLLLRLAARDTAGHADDPGRLDSVAVALLRLARLDQAGGLFGSRPTSHPKHGAGGGARGKAPPLGQQPARAPRPPSGPL